MFSAAGGDGHQVGLHLALGVRLGQLGLTCRGECVGSLLGEMGKPVVQVLRRLAHDERGWVDQLFRKEAGVRVDTFAHRMVAHVLDPCRDDDVVGTERNAGRRRGHCGHGAGAHPVDGVTGDGSRQARKKCRRSADGQTLVPDLGGGGDGDLVDAVRWQGRVAAQQFADALDDEVVGPGFVVHALGSSLAERGSDTVDKDDVTKIAAGTRHGPSLGCRGRCYSSVTRPGYALPRRDCLSAAVQSQAWAASDAA